LEEIAIVKGTMRGKVNDFRLQPLFYGIIVAGGKMSQTIEALFDGEILRPDESLNLRPNTRVRITIEESTIDRFYTERVCLSIFSGLF